MKSENEFQSDEPQVSHEPMYSTAYRESARRVIEQRIKYHTKMIQMYTTLMDNLPAKMPPDFDEAMWEILISARRYHD